MGVDQARRDLTVTPSEVFWVPLEGYGGGVAKSILHLLNAGCWAHKRQVSQTIDLVQYGAKNRASFDGTRGANGPKVVGGWWGG